MPDLILQKIMLASFIVFYAWYAWMILKSTSGDGVELFLIGFIISAFVALGVGGLAWAGWFIFFNWG